MPRAKTIENYPKSFFRLLERAAQNPVAIATASPSAAKNLRSELYVFRSVLREEAKRVPKHALLAEDIRFRVEGATLYVEPRPLARSRLIAEVLKTKAELPGDTDHDNDPPHPKSAAAR